LEENNITIHPIDSIPINFSIPVMPFDTYACVIGTFTDWNEYKMMKSYVKFLSNLII
jgi:hypothetical protein